MCIRDRGWSVANALLGLERIFLGLPKLSVYALSRLKYLMDLTGAWNDASAADCYVRLQLDLEDHIALYENFVDRLRETGSLGADVSILKLHQTELYQKITDAMLEVAGEYAGFVDPIPGSDGLYPAAQFLLARPATIFGGSSEIQRNILATRVLDLPRG